jgi:hypothetical protein
MNPKRADDRDRHGHRRDQGGPPLPQEHEDDQDDEDDRDQQRPLDVATEARIVTVWSRRSSGRSRG